MKILLTLSFVFLTQSAVGAPALKSLVIDQQPVTLFEDVYNLLSAFERVQVGSTDQRLQEQPATGVEIQNNPLLIYRNRPALLVTQADYSDPQQMADSVLSAVARADLPRELLLNPVWQKFLVLVPKIAQGRLLSLNKSERRIATLVLGGFCGDFEEREAMTVA